MAKTGQRAVGQAPRGALVGLGISRHVHHTQNVDQGYCSLSGTLASLAAKDERVDRLSQARRDSSWIL